MSWLRSIFCALAALLVFSSCANNKSSSVIYHKLVYEVTSSPSVNMEIRYMYPGINVLSSSRGSSFRQECPGVEAGFGAFMSAQVITDKDHPTDAQVSIKIYLDDQLKCQTSDMNFAKLEFTVSE